MRNSSISILAAAVLAAPAFAETIVVPLNDAAAGQEIIYIPGLGSSPEAMSWIVRALPDIQWYGLSVAGFANSPVDAAMTDPMADMIAAVVRHADSLDCPILIGHSMGALVAVEAAVQAHVCGLVLLDGPPVPGAVMVAEPTPAALTELADQMALPIADMSQQDVMDWAGQMAAGWALDPAARQNVATMVGASDPATISRAFHQVLTADVTKLLPQVTAPVLVVTATPDVLGMTDEMIGGFYMQAYAGLPDATFVHIPEARHFVMLDNPDATVAAITEFLAGL